MTNGSRDWRTWALGLFGALILGGGGFALTDRQTQLDRVQSRFDNAENGLRASDGRSREADTLIIERTARLETHYEAIRLDLARINAKLDDLARR